MSLLSWWLANCSDDWRFSKSQRCCDAAAALASSKLPPEKRMRRGGSNMAAREGLLVLGPDPPAAAPVSPVSALFFLFLSTMCEGKYLVLLFSIG